MIYSFAYGLSWSMFHVHLKIMCILQLLGRMFHIYLLVLLGLYCCSSLFISLCISCLVVLSNTENGNIDVSNYYCWIVVYLSFQLCQILLHVFLGSVVSYISIYNCYFFLINWILSDIWNCGDISPWHWNLGPGSAVWSWDPSLFQGSFCS